jgi:hypothetical protein
MSAMIIVTVITADADAVSRTPDGAPYVRAEAQQARVFLATPHDTGWLVETWQQAGAEYKPESQVELTDTDDLAADVARTVRDIATTTDR